MPNHLDRPDFFTRHNGERAPLAFSQAEYDRRIAALRSIMEKRDVSHVVLTSMHNIAYYSGFLYCAFGRPYACVVSQTHCTVVSANIDGSQPWRQSHCDSVIYTDWQRNNYWRAVGKLTDGAKRIGIERRACDTASENAVGDCEQTPRCAESEGVNREDNLEVK